MAPAATPPPQSPEEMRAALEAALARAERFEQEIARQNLEIELLLERIRLILVAKYGPRSEKLSSLQLSLLEEEPGVTLDEVAAEAERPALTEESQPAEQAAGPPAADAEPPRKRGSNPGRRSFPEHLPRVEEIVVCAPEACRCGACGQETAVMGYEESERLDCEKPRLFVRVIRREKRVCRHCTDARPVTAPVAPSIVDKGLAGDALVIETIVAKYADHVPLYRQSEIWRREMGVDLSRVTLDAWVMRVGELLLPLTRALRRQLLASEYLQADETTVPVQIRNHKGKNHQAYLWQYGKPGGETVFDFRLGRSREGPKSFLGDFAGLLQTDGYAAYNKCGQGMTQAACWAHARRGFAEVLRLNPRDAAARSLVEEIDALFAIDARARKEQWTLAQRHEARAEKAPALLAGIQQRAQKVENDPLATKRLREAASYMLKLWTRLTRFLAYPELELSNNLAENSMRPVALGRKNWLHVGSETAGPKVAAILSIVESCKRIGAPLREYLADILPGLADRKIDELPELTPARWLAHKYSTKTTLAA
jgi:transposase